MNLDLAGKKAIVTGGSSGIGYWCAATLRVEGVGVLLAALPSGLEEAAGRLRELPSPAPAAEVAAVPCDLRLPDDIERVVHTALERLGAIDILINCAGAAQAGSFLNLPDGAFLDAWTLKLLGYIRTVRVGAPLMIKRHDGRIVNIVGASARSASMRLSLGSRSFRVAAAHPTSSGQSVTSLRSTRSTSWIALPSGSKKKVSPTPPKGGG